MSSQIATVEVGLPTTLDIAGVELGSIFVMRLEVFAQVPC